VSVLYISPLKALNYDIERNLRQPLAGVTEQAGKAGAAAPDVRVAVRTGDTPARERASMARNPPDILITTPESLYLILTSPHTRSVLASVETVIVDEIHAVCGSKRGAHLAVSLERLERLSGGFQRIGLSATQRPLDEVARYLGGQAAGTPRQVTVIDAAFPKALDLRVFGMPEAKQAAFPGSIWPQLVPRVLDDVRAHRTTLIFCNSRMQAERMADRLNAQSFLEDSGRTGAEPALAPGGTPIAEGLIGTGIGTGVFKAHHGSISEAVRRSLEEDLKAGRLPALIGTSSLELGIDIGAIDLVVQVQSPKSVARGLQRVGRAGHLVGETSHGRIYATHNEDLLEAGVVARGMRERDIEAVKIPRNPLDVLAQQVVAAVSVDDWKADDLYELCRQAYPYADLSRASFDSVLRLVAGRYSSKRYRPLGARIFWDEAGGTLNALPGSRFHAMANGGTIVDRGEFAVYLPDGRTRLGELDEEFVWESRAGDVFTLGSETWRALEIRDDRVIAEPAPGALPRMPFWKGEFPWRPFELSLKLARFRAELAERVAPYVERDDDPPEAIGWLRDDYGLDDAGARQAVGYVRGQLRALGAISSDRTVIVETYADGVGDTRLVVHSPFGGRVNAGWALAVAAELAGRTGVQPDMQVSDDGFMFRLPESDSAVSRGLLESLTAEAAREHLLRHLDESPLFGALFRQNATRALLMPVSTRGRRTPFWLQRRRAKDLMSIAREFPDFPVTLETYRDCLEDSLDLGALERVLGDIQSGRIGVVYVESKAPSPVARSLNYAFTNVYLYEWDTPKAERATSLFQVDRAALASLVKEPGFAELLRPEAVDQVIAEVSRTAPGYRARSAAELAQLLEEAGDLNLDEVRARCEGDAPGWLAELEGRGLVRAVEVEWGSKGEPERRWIAAGRLSEFERLERQLPEQSDARREAVTGLVRTFIASRGPVASKEIAGRYGVAEAMVVRVLARLEAEEAVLSGRFVPGSSALLWASPDVVARIQSRTLAILRREVRPVSVLRYATAVRRRQRVAQGEHDGAPAFGSPDTTDRARSALESMRGVVLPYAVWDRIVFSARIGPAYGDAVEAMFRSGEHVWLTVSDGTGKRSIAVFPRASGRLFLPDMGDGAARAAALGEVAVRVWEFLKGEGTATSADLRTAFRDLSVSQLATALARIVDSGLATADSWHVLGVLAVRRAATAAEMDTGPWAGGGERRARALGERPTDERDRRSRSLARRAAARAIRESSVALPPEVRWSVASRFGVMGEPRSENDRAAAWAAALGERYGVVTRHALQNESSEWPWGPIVSQLSLMEMRGRIRRGYFVSGLPGLQFAAGDAIEMLRSGDGARGDHEARGGGEVELVNAADPAFAIDRALFESTPDLPGVLAGVSRVPSTWVAFAGEFPVLVAEDDGRRIRAETEARWEGSIATAVRRMRTVFSRFESRVVVERWNGDAAAGSAGAEALQAAGFRRDYPGMVFDQVQARLEGLRETRPG
jgi:ATP-dependent Lhr-like helicase